MPMRFGSIIIHKPDPNSDGNHSSSDEAEVAEIAETAVQKYSRTRKPNSNLQHRTRSERHRRKVAQKDLLQRKMGSRKSSGSSISSNEVPILKALAAADKSPPLNRSHYILPAAASLIDDRLHDGFRPRTNSESSTDSSSSRSTRRSMISQADDFESNERFLGFRVITSASLGSRSSIDGYHQRRGSSVSADARLHSNYPHTSNANSHPNCETIFDEEEQISGLGKLLRNLNIREKLRQQKAEQDRLNVHKLPNHMKEQLKHLYVY